MHKYLAPGYSKNQLLKHYSICNIDRASHVSNLDPVLLELLVQQRLPLNYCKIKEFCLTYCFLMTQRSHHYLRSGNPLVILAC